MKTTKTDAEQVLLQLSRHVLTEFTTNGLNSFPDASLQAFKFQDIALEERGVFVTLTKGDQLRGCIGTILSNDPVYRGVIENTITASSQDPRFAPVKASELEQIQIEISIMSPFEPVMDIENIEIGKHGLIIQMGRYSGLLLPQVPIEWNWDRQTYLEQLCRKAGLPMDAYKQPNAKLFSFTARVFGESSA